MYFSIKSTSKLYMHLHVVCTVGLLIIRLFQYSDFLIILSCKKEIQAPKNGTDWVFE